MCGSHFEAPHFTDGIHFAVRPVDSGWRSECKPKAAYIMTVHGVRLFGSQPGGRAVSASPEGLARGPRPSAAPARRARSLRPSAAPERLARVLRAHCWSRRAQRGVRRVQAEGVKDETEAVAIAIQRKRRSASLSASPAWHHPPRRRRDSNPGSRITSISAGEKQKRMCAAHKPYAVTT